MNSLQIVNAHRQISDFVDYVDGVALTKEHIRHATIVYLDRCNNDDFENCTWGDGDSLDRERVRDILTQKFGYGESKYYRSVTV